MDLGFLEEVASWKLKSKFFPSKVGGKPAWLDLKNLPTTEALKCQLCSKQMLFLCQVYAPIETKDDAFHRTIFVFMCKNPSCCIQNSNKNFLVLRNQLARRNPFYDYNPPEQDESMAYQPSASDFSKLCEVCGCPGPKSCSRCKLSSYCSKDHQLIDWKEFHKNVCTKTDCINDGRMSSLLMKEYEIVIDEESSDEESDGDDVNPALPEKDCELDEEEFESYCIKEDKVFSKFQKEIKRSPDQILRYKREGIPLLLSSISSPLNIPPCECGSQRVFEFQLMPQLLNYLSLDCLGKSIDWGTLLVYTCQDSCSMQGYTPEYLWKQDVDSPT